jgi:hypothetical protein
MKLILEFMQAKSTLLEKVVNKNIKCEKFRDFPRYKKYLKD